MWHRQGKVSLTKGSDVVTGVGTNWVENIRVGDAFQGPDGKLYQVINVASNEALAISPAYEGATATNLNYWIVPVPGYSKTQADRLSLIISKLDGDIITATEAADRAQAAAQQAQQWRDEAAVSAAAALQSEQSAALSADVAEQARDDAVAVVTGGTASIDPDAGKIPIAGADAAIKQAWVKDLEFELDALRVAKNKVLYGDGPYPVIDLQFQGAKYLDPRIEFTRASKDWDEYGNEYGIDEPVLTNKGFWVSGARTDLFANANSAQAIAVTAQSYTLSFYGMGSVQLTGVHVRNVEGSGARTTYTFTPTAGQLVITPKGVDRVQLEEGVTATPFIPTEGSQVTVAEARLRSIQTEGARTLFWDVELIKSTSSSVVYFLSWGLNRSGNIPENGLFLWSESVGRLQPRVYSNKSFTSLPFLSVDYREVRKIAVTVRDGVVAFSANGEYVELATDEPFHDYIKYANINPSTTNQSKYRWIKSITVYRESMSREKMMELTAS